MLVAFALAAVVAILAVQARRVINPEDPVVPAIAPIAVGDTTAAPPSRGAAVRSGRASPFDGVDTELLATIEDDTVFRTAEADAWFHLLALLQKSSAHGLEQAAPVPVGYLQLDQQSSEYRGQLVTVRGTVRGGKRVAAPPNDFGITQYYQLWLQPDRSSPELIVVYALTTPDGFSLGSDLDAETTATGFYFKRWAYPAADGVATAPLVLARGIDWRRQPAPTVAAPRAEQLAWVVVAALVAAAVMVCVFVARERALSRARSTDSAEVELQTVLSNRYESPIDRADVEH